MSDVTYLGQRVTNLEVSPQFDTYSKVIIHIDDETAIEVGDNTGRTLEVTNPFGTQAMAQNLLNSLRGFQYQPYDANGALLNPAAEIGDAANMLGAYGGIYTRSRTFGRLMKTDISAPQDEEINHEYTYESQSERKFKRETADIRASILLTNEQITAEVTRATQAEGTLSSRITQNANSITAKVSASGGSNVSGSFAWVLNASGHRWYANGNSTPVMSVTASGLTVNGTINSTSGKIGGFTIGSAALYNGISSFGATGTNGVYVGTNGIQLGESFKVTPTGQVTASNINASNIKLSGVLTIGDATITADSLRQGAERANAGYGAWNGTTNTVSANSGFWSAGASGGMGWTNATTSASGQAANLWVGNFWVSKIVASGAVSINQSGSFKVTSPAAFNIHGYNATWKSIDVGTGLSIATATNPFRVTAVSLKKTTIYYLGR